MNAQNWAITPTLEALGVVNSYLKLRAGDPDDEGWYTTPQLLADDLLLDTLLTQVMRAHNTEDRRFGAMSFANSYWIMIAAALGAYYLAGRVPFVSADNIAFRMEVDNGHVDEIAFLSGRFYCLPNDPNADDRDAVVLADRDALRVVLRQQLEAHLTPVIDGLKERSPLGKRALWAAIADHCSSIIITATRLLGQGEQCEQEIAQTVNVTGSPLKGKSGALWVEHNGQRQAFLKRASCCLSYMLPADYGYCATCPLLSVDERFEKLKQYIEAN